MIGVEVHVGAKWIPDGSAGPPVDPIGEYVADTLTMTWGRESTTDQPPPATATFTITRPPSRGGLLGWLRVGEVARIYTTPDHRCVFIGAITGLSMSWDPERGQPVVTVTADDVLADLGQRRAGAAPWAKEPLATRVANVLAATRRDIPVTIGTQLQATMMAKQDIDVRTGTDVLDQVAASVDGVLWATASLPPAWPNDIPALRLEDPQDRPAMRRLTMAQGVIVIVVYTDGIAGLVTLPACAPDLEGVTFDQDVADRVTRVSVTYYTPDPTDGTRPDIGTTLDVVDAAAEDPSGVWGVRGVDLDSLLTSQADATAIGGRILGRLRILTWTAQGLTFDQATSPDVTDTLVTQLLDIRTRHGQAVVIPLPSWAPADQLVGYLEGGTYRHTRGSWRLDLNVSAGQGYGSSSVVWNDLPDDPAWTWNAWATGITWEDLNGVGPPIGVSA